jgi:hypothetical protein
MSWPLRVHVSTCRPWLLGPAARLIAVFPFVSEEKRADRGIPPVHQNRRAWIMSVVGYSLTLPYLLAL